MLTTVSPLAFQFNSTSMGPSVAFTETTLGMTSTYTRSGGSSSRAGPSGLQSHGTIEVLHLEELPKADHDPIIGVKHF